MKKNKGKRFELIKNILFVLVVVSMILVIVFNNTHYRIVVNGDSMEPTVYPLETGYMQKIYSFSKIERFDVVAVNINTDSNGFETNYIKRIIGLPGESIKIINNELFINDIFVEQTFAYTNGNNADGMFTLNENEYLISGDNRAVTVSSLIIKKEQIIAKNGFVYAKYEDHTFTKKSLITWRMING